MSPFASTRRLAMYEFVPCLPLIHVTRKSSPSDVISIGFASACGGAISPMSTISSPLSRMPCSAAPKSTYATRTSVFEAPKDAVAERRLFKSKRKRKRRGDLTRRAVDRSTVRIESLRPKRERGKRGGGGGRR